MNVWKSSGHTPIHALSVPSSPLPTTPTSITPPIGDSSKKRSHKLTWEVQIVSKRKM